MRTLNNTVSSTGYAFVFALLALVSATVWSYEGRVVDKDTGKPIEGAYVIGTWRGYIPDWVQRSSTCYHLETTITDKDGWFSLPPWSWNFAPWIVDRERGLHIYKAGYSRLWTGNRENTVWHIAPFKGITKERLDELFGIRGNTDCGPSKYHQEKLLGLNKALLEESKAISADSQDKKVVNSLQHAVDRLEFGEEEAYRRLKAGVYGK